MRILIVSSFLPYPLHSGGHVRLYNLMKQLSKNHKLTLVCEKRDFQTEKDVIQVRKLCEEVYYVNRKKQWSSENIIKTGFSAYPFLLTGHTQPDMKEIIVSLLREKTFDLVHVETFYVMHNLPKTYLPVVLAEHNIEYEVYKKYVEKAPLFIRPLLLADIAKIKFWENKFWKEAKKLVAVSEADKEEMGREDVVVVPNGVDLKNFKYSRKAGSRFAGQQKEKRILFIGDFKWIQNKEAANWILDEIWPKIQSSIVNNKLSINLKLWIVGKNIPENIKEQNGGSIIIDENAPDETSKIYQKSFILLAPITIGGGTSYKILESMASGVPVVTTEMGVRGLGAKHTKHALVGTTSTMLAQQAISLIENKKKYSQIQEEARKLIEEKYSWGKIAVILEKVYEDAIEK